MRRSNHELVIAPFPLRPSQRIFNGDAYTGITYNNVGRRGVIFLDSRFEPWPPRLHLCPYRVFRISNGPGHRRESRVVQPCVAVGIWRLRIFFHRPVDIRESRMSTRKILGQRSAADIRESRIATAGGAAAGMALEDF